MKITHRKQIDGEILKIKNEDIMDYFKFFIFERLPSICFPKGLYQKSPMLPLIFLN